MSCNLSLHPRNKHAVAASPLLPQLVQSAQSCHAGEEVSLPLTLPPPPPPNQAGTWTTAATRPSCAYAPSTARSTRPSGRYG